MVYGTLGLINFAHGEVFMIGCYIGLYAAFWLGYDALSAASFSPMSATLVLLLAMTGAAIVGMLIERPADVEPALREAIRLKDRTVFLDVRTDPTENVWPMVQAGKGISEMLLGSEDL
jgi:acetolactate synthase-1/2/3 large subunit